MWEVTVIVSAWHHGSRSALRTTRALLLTTNQDRFQRLWQLLAAMLSSDNQGMVMGSALGTAWAPISRQLQHMQ